MKYNPYLLLANQAVNKATDTNSSWVSSVGTSPQEPTGDDFYKFDAGNITQYALGDILNVREIGLGNYNYSKAWQILYRSENTWGFPTASVTTVVLPENFNSTGSPANVVSYQQAEDASFLDCNPSYTLLTQKTSSDLQSILDKGYVLNYPDHEGQNSSFTAGPLEGKLTLDSLRALKKAQNLTGVETGKAILWGYSGGSIATGWAAELYDWYAPELDIAAMAVGGFVVNLTATVELVNGTPLVGFVPPGVLGLAAEYPDLAKLVTEQIKPEFVDKAKQALSQCTLEDIVEFANLNVFDVFQDGEAVLEQPGLKDTLKNTTLGSSTPQVPMIVYNGIMDQIAPISAVDNTVRTYCDNGGKIRYIRGSGKDHVGAATAFDDEVLDSFASIFAGNVWDSCSVEGLPIGDYGNDTVPQPKVLGNSTNSTGSSNSSSTGNSTTGNATSSAGSNGTQTSVGSETGSATKHKTTSGAASGTGSATGTASATSSSSSKSSNAANANGITGALGVVVAALALL